MNLINLITRNKFLAELFPSGLTDPVLIGQINLDLGGKLYLNIHTRQKPEIEVLKWGAWGKDYNTIVVKLYARARKNLHITDWNNVTYSQLITQQNSDHILLKQTHDSFQLELELTSLIFQECSTYTDDLDIDGNE
ncbi:hypothetical protein B0T40_23715 [Chromobacterium haemolyticum]|uniref:hypothetical protein n=1 Tax=Chromobacterium haemolyticum TaxID=394935 RepID=UPI0009F04E9B|nr:hypothetical protein [Chromobacterium haemolyticum]OQS31025.1 hypothetical protein B0T40_23715 [Chromobacterium haemolyticum]